MKQRINSNGKNLIGERLKELRNNAQLSQRDLARELQLIGIDMDKNVIREYLQKFNSELFTSVLPFWEKFGADPVNGGVRTCLDREGKVFSAEKSVWMQGRGGWMFANLCHNYGVKDEWLAASKSCLDFMEKYCINRECGDRMYFTVTEDGKPLRQRRYYYSEAFYASANAE